MRPDEVQALVNQTQAQLDTEQSTYSTEKQGIDSRVSEIRQSIEFNKKEAQKIRDYGGDEKTAADFEQKSKTLEQELETQEQNMRLALDRKKQRINEIKSTLERQAAKLEDAQDRQKLINVITLAVRYGTDQ